MSIRNVFNCKVTESLPSTALRDGGLFAQNAQRYVVTGVDSVARMASGRQVLSIFQL